LNAHVEHHSVLTRELDTGDAGIADRRTKNQGSLSRIVRAMPGAMVLVVIHNDEKFRQFSSSVGSCLLPGLSSVDKETSLRHSQLYVAKLGRYLLIGYNDKI
jgi:hypothetical protein